MITTTTQETNIIKLTADTQEVRISANSSGKGLARNAIVSYISTFVGMGTGFIATPILLHHLGSNYFGLWMLLNTVVGYTGLLELGLQITISKRVAECLALNNKTRLSVVISTAIGMYTAFSFLVLLAAATLVLTCGSIFHLVGKDLEIARECLLILGANQAIAFLFNFQSAILFGAGRSDLSTSYGTIIGIVVTSISLWLVVVGYGIIALAVLLTCATIITGIVGRIVIRAKLPAIHAHPSRISKEMIIELLKFGSRNATLAVAGNIAYNTDTVIIALLLPISNVAYYAIAAKVVNIIVSLSSKPMTVLLPAYTHSDAKGDIQRQQRLFTESIKISTGVALPFVISLCIFGSRIITAWVGATSADTVSIAIILSLVSLLLLPGYASSSLLTATEKNLALVRIYLVAAAINLIMSYFLTVRFGSIGVALGSLITVSVVDAVLLPVIVCRLLALPFLFYIHKIYVPLLWPLLGSVTIAEVLIQLTLSSERLITLAILVAVIITGWVMMFLTSIEIDQRKRYINLARNILRR